MMMEPCPQCGRSTAVRTISKALTFDESTQTAVEEYEVRCWTCKEKTTIIHHLPRVDATDRKPA